MRNLEEMFCLSPGPPRRFLFRVGNGRVSLASASEKRPETGLGARKSARYNNTVLPGKTGSSSRDSGSEETHHGKERALTAGTGVPAVQAILGSIRLESVGGIGGLTVRRPLASNWLYS